MPEKKSKADKTNYWEYAIVNGRLATIWASKAEGVHSHGYLPSGKPYLKSHKRMMERDLKKNVFSYRNYCYRNKITKEIHQIDLKEMKREEKRREKELQEFLKKLKKQTV